MWFLLGWLALAALVAFTFGSPISAMLAGFMVAVHAGALVDLLWRSREFDDWPTATIAILGWTAAACLVALVLYVPVRWGILSVVDARQWLIDVPPLQSGDVVLFRPTSNAKTLHAPGEVVLYRTTELSIGQGSHRVLQRPVGEGLDRIIAGGGSLVRWREGKLTIDGQPSELRPLNPERMPEEFEIKIPSGCVCIFPTTDDMLAAADSLEIWLQQSVVRQDAIVGRAVMRNYPFWRFWWIR